MVKAARLTDIETSVNEQTPPPAIPAGVDAKVRVEYTTKVDPNNEQAREDRYSDELRELAAAQDFNEALPLDPLSQFCAEWRNYIGYPMKVTRLADPATRRIPGQAYNRPCFEVEYLSDTPFDPANLTGTLQIINGNSGGVFRLWLVDPQTNAPIPEAHVDRVVIADPPKNFGNNPQSQREFDPRYDVDPRRPWPPPQQTPPPPPQPSALELRMQNLQEKLLENALARLIEPPPTVPQPGGSANISDSDRLTLMLVNEGGMLPGIVSKIAALAGAPEAAVAKQSLGERALEAGMRIAETNPAIVERISSTLERIVNRILPADPRAPVSVAANIQPSSQASAPQPQQITPAPPIGAIEPAPDTPNPDDGPEVDDDEIMDIIEQLFTLLSDTRPFTVDDPVFVELRQAYPLKFRMAVQLIATQPLDAVIEWIKTQGTLYEALLDSPISGKHYASRLAELQQFCRTPAAPPQPATASNENETSQTEKLRNPQSEIRNSDA